MKTEKEILDRLILYHKLLRDALKSDDFVAVSLLKSKIELLEWVLKKEEKL